jgi:hypothetical protein
VKKWRRCWRKARRRRIGSLSSIFDTISMLAAVYFKHLIMYVQEKFVWMLPDMGSICPLVSVPSIASWWCFWRYFRILTALYRYRHCIVLLTL